MKPFSTAVDDGDKLGLHTSHVFGIFSEVLSSWVKNENISKLFIL